MAVAPRPTVSDLLDYMNLTSNQFDTAEADEALRAALELQAAECVVGPYTDALAMAAKRRAAAQLIAKGHPLGQIDTGQFGSIPIPGYDPTTANLERPYRRGPFA